MINSDNQINQDQEGDGTLDPWGISSRSLAIIPLFIVFILLCLSGCASNPAPVTNPTPSPTPSIDNHTTIKRPCTHHGQSPRGGWPRWWRGVCIQGGCVIRPTRQSIRDEFGPVSQFVQSMGKLVLVPYAAPECIAALFSVGLINVNPQGQRHAYQVHPAIRDTVRPRFT